MNFSDLKGKTLTKISGDKGDEVMYFTTSEGEEYRLIYHQDCCADAAMLRTRRAAAKAARVRWRMEPR